MNLRHSLPVGLAIGLAFFGVTLLHQGFAGAYAAPAWDPGAPAPVAQTTSASETVSKPADPNAVAWRLWLTLNADVQAKIDPRLLDEFQGAVVPTHLKARVAPNAPTAPRAMTRFLVYLTAEPDLAALSQQVFASSVAQRTAVHSLLVNVAQASQASLVTLLDNRISAGRVAAYQPFHIANMLAVEGDLMTVIELARRSDVAHIDANYPLVPLWEPAIGPQPQESSVSAAALSPSNWNIDLVDADRVWSQFNLMGEGAVVAGFDTGVVYSHPALAQQYRGRQSDGRLDHNYNWFEPNSTLYPNGAFGASLSNEPYDCDGYTTHGTHTMGTMVGDGGTEETKIGMAPGARWIAVPGICGGTMSGMQGDDIGGLKAFQWLLCPTDLSGAPATADCSKAPDVINNSWGSANPTNEVFRPVLKALRAAGIAPVFAAGNPAAGPGSIGSPGNAPEAITVGAIDYAELVAEFSGRGPSFYAGEQKPELSAPGVDVLSSVDLEFSNYAYYSGTSMAAPHVAGLIALLVSADLRDGTRDFSVDELERFMTFTARDLGETGADVDYGYGRINAFEAARWALSAGDLVGVVRDAATTAPLANATVTGRSVGTTGAFATRSSTTGLYSTTVPSGAYAVDVGAWGYLTSTFSAQQVFAGALSVADFALQPLSTAPVQGQVVDPNGGVAGAHVYVAAAPWVETTTAADGGYVLTLPVGAHELVVESVGHRRYRAVVTVPAAGASFPIALETAPKILLVDADARYGWFVGWPVYPIFSWALDESAYVHDLWRIQSTVITDTTTLVDGSVQQGLPSLATLQQYDVVIWTQSACFSRTSGCIRSLGAVMTDRLAAYLHSGGRMLISGQDIAYYDDGTEFFDQYLRADLLYDSAAIEGERLTGNQFLNGISLDLTNASLYGYANGVFYLSPDAVVPQTDVDSVGSAGEMSSVPVSGMSYSVMSYEQASGAAMLATIPCNADYRLLYYPVGYENVGPRGLPRNPQIAETLARSIAWLTEPRSLGDVVLTVESARRDVAPGRAVAYQLDLVNGRNSPTQVRVQVRDNGWQTQVMSGSVPLDGPFLAPPCSRTGLTVRVTAPENTQSGVTDQATLEPVVEGVPVAFSSITLTTTVQVPWTVEPSTQGTRWLHGMAAAGDRYLYAAGGFDAVGPRSTLDRYDVCTQRWENLLNLPVPLAGAGAAMLDGQLYLVGGFTFEDDNNWQLVDTVYIYDLQTNRLRTTAPLPLPLAGVATAVYDGKLYAFGGTDFYWLSSMAFVYDPAVGQWQELPPLPYGIEYAGAVALGERIYVIGGTYFTTMGLVYQPATNEWLSIAPTNALHWHTMAVAGPDNQLYVASGPDLYNVSGRVERYDPATDRWEFVASFQDRQRLDAAAAYVAGRIYVVGGIHATQPIEALTLAPSVCQSRKDGPPIALPGSRMTYALDLVADAAWTGQFQVVDPLPDSLQFVRFVDPPAGAIYDEATHQILWTTVLPAGNDHRRLVYEVDVMRSPGGTAAPGGVIKNTAFFALTGYPTPGATTTFTREVASVVVPPDLTLSTKTVTPLRVGAGQPVTYTIDVRSSVPAGDLMTVRDALPAGMQVVPGTLTASTGEATIEDNGRAVRWDGEVAASGDAFINVGNEYAWGDSTGEGRVPDVGFEWQDIRTTGVRLDGGDDITHCELPTGFSFPFFGVMREAFCVSSNGVISFSSSAYSTPFVNACPLSSFAGADTSIAAVWDDLVVDDAIYYQTFGDAPHRYLVVQWQNARPYAVYTQGYSTFQAVLHENGAIELNVLEAGAEDGGRSTTGLVPPYGDERSVTYACDTPGTLRNKHSVRFLPPGLSAGGESASLQFQAVADETIGVNQWITNTVRIEGSNAVYTRTAAAFFNPISLASSSLEVDRAELGPGESVRYRAILRNDGLQTAARAVLRGALPAGFVLMAGGLNCSSGQCALHDGELVWEGAVAPDNPVEITLELRLEQPLADNTSVSLELTLEDGYGSRHLLAVTVVARRSDLTPTTLEFLPMFIEPGRSSELSVHVHNAGRQATDARLVVDLPPGLTVAASGPICGRGRCWVEENKLYWEGLLDSRTVVPVRLVLQAPADAPYDTSYRVAGLLTDTRWGDTFQLSSALQIAHNSYLPTMAAPIGAENQRKTDAPNPTENHLYMPLIQ